MTLARTIEGIRYDAVEDPERPKLGPKRERALPSGSGGHFSSLWTAWASVVRGKKVIQRNRGRMGYVLRVRMASFFAGAATASFIGFYILYNDYKVAHQSVSHQMKGLHNSLDRRIAALEKLKQAETSQPAEAAE
ncbi:hypothetical protein SAY86_023688 [Trapa natans]|uniref:Transmembrane protein n=1 Tax=Trapa natans TaxID=22666 RepID=A0AAN7M886_TRANT|nr:hypothetical protein SAY86_023688 [Trapa natans]